MKWTRTFNLIMIVLLVGAILSMYACSKTDANGVTVGQKVDQAIDQTNATVADAGSKIADSADHARTALEDTGEKIQNRATKAADRAGGALNDAGGAVRDRAEHVASVVDDSLITASIKADLLKDPGLSTFRVDVSTVQGQVTLTGDVDTDAAKQRASRLAMAIAGVVGVNNQLGVARRRAPGAALRSPVDGRQPMTLARMRLMV